MVVNDFILYVFKIYFPNFAKFFLCCYARILITSDLLYMDVPVKCWESHFGVVANMLNCEIVVKVFEFQSHLFV